MGCTLKKYEGPLEFFCIGNLEYEDQLARFRLLSYEANNKLFNGAYEEISYITYDVICLYNRLTIYKSKHLHYPWAVHAELNGPLKVLSTIIASNIE